MGKESDGQRTRREALERLAADPEESMRCVCEAVSVGKGLVYFAVVRGVSYWSLWRWIHEDPIRSGLFEEAINIRGALNAEAADAVARKLVNPDEPTGVPWLDANPEPLDPKAARVAMDGFRWSAQVTNRERFGRQTEHKHTVSVQHEHLQALKALLARSPSANALPSPQASRALAHAGAVDAEFTILDRIAARPHPVDIVEHSLAHAVLAPFRLTMLNDR